MITLRNASPCTSMPCQKLLVPKRTAFSLRETAPAESSAARSGPARESAANRLEPRLKRLAASIEHFVAGEQHKRPAVGHLEILDDLLAGGGEKPLRVARLGEICSRRRASPARIIKRRAKLQRPGVLHAKARGDVFEGGGNFRHNRGMGVSPVFPRHSLSGRPQSPHHIFPSISNPQGLFSLDSPRRSDLMEQIVFVANQVIVILRLPKCASPL